MKDSTLYPPTKAQRAAVDAALSASADPEMVAPVLDRPTPPGSVALSIVTDRGVAARVTLRAGDPLLPDLLARRATRVRDVAPGVVLPDPVAHPQTPLSALLEDFR